ncbi:MAG: DUF3810 domain-containing protein [Lachnospiraceae bacterium]|nr:DUF3810 domain-containing protein [Lachnospiraceae bacterium]
MKKRIFTGILTVVAVLNLLAWNSTEFCDFYKDHVFVLWVNTYSRFTDIFPFSVGEWMLGLGVLLCTFLILCLLTEGIRFFVRVATRQSFSFTRFSKRFFKQFAWIFLVVSVLMTCNCFILYHCSGFWQENMNTRFPVARQEEKQYTVKSLGILRDYIVKKADVLAEAMERDQDGNVIYRKDIKEQAIQEMKRMGTLYGGLAGYYPHPKGILSSNFLSQQYMMGYYFPFSMEANYNTQMYIMNMPVTMCHELSHLKGYIYEDEANFIGYLACIGSSDPVFQYSGYLSVLSYVNNDYYEALGKNSALYNTHVKVSSLVKHDRVFLTEKTWEKVEKKAVIKTETVHKAANTFLENNLTVNGVEEGVASYGQVVGLLLQYYDGILYGGEE